MAKVKIQAGTQGSVVDLPAPGSTSSKKMKQDGAVTLLSRILRQQGFSGWYQV